MKTSKNEFLSALLDGEAGEFEQRRLLDELEQNETLGQTLARYTLAGEVMRSQPKTVIADSQSFLAGIQDQLEDDPVYGDVPMAAANESSIPDNVISIDKKSSWRSHLFGYGLAAGIAALAAVTATLTVQNQSAGNQMMAGGDNAGVPLDVEHGVVASFAEQEPVMPQARFAVMDSSTIDSRIQRTNQHLDWQTRDALRQYVTLHMQHRSMNGIVPSIQAASYSQ